MRVTGLKGTAARVALARAQRRGHIAKAGPRSRLYFNCLNGPVTTTRRLEALAQLYPEAVLMGGSLLHGAGWSTEAPPVVTVAVSNASPRVELEGFMLHRRPPRWFRELESKLLPADQHDIPTFGLPALFPQAALEDLRHDPKAWRPPADSLRIPESPAE